MVNTTKHRIPLSGGPPRLDPRLRQLSRFYEPLVLLHTLGSTRGERLSPAFSNQTNVSQLPLKEVRRRLLDELAYMCDYDKGGDTVTAIGLESTPQKYVFWVASNSSPQTKIVPFLELLLATLKHRLHGAEEIATQCIYFATPRVKKYASHLKPPLRRCLIWLARKEREDERGLAAWLRDWELQRSPTELCRFAFANRKSDHMRTLARLGTETVHKSSPDAIQHAFSSVRHYIGRLGHHFRAADALLSCAIRLPELFDDYEVRGICTPPKSVFPPADAMTTLKGIITRMLPARCPDLDRYQQAIAEMDAKYNLSHRFLENYTDANRKPRVHAEIQVLEHFHAHALSFAGADPFISCSKPACFCCLLYFRNHPGNFVEPVSHHKIYLNWQPPDPNTDNNLLSRNHQRNILNDMVIDIRKDALRQLDEKSGPRAWHPDSLTGITPSNVHDQWKADLEEARDVVALTERMDAVNKQPLAKEALFERASATSFPSVMGGVSPDSAEHDQYTTLQTYQQVFDIFEEDSDEEGGVLLYDSL